jgi:hypothetical protein
MPVQAWALHEAAEFGGLLGPIGVGAGKSLLDLLTAMVVPGVRTAVLLLPPQLKSQLVQKDIPFYGQHWKLPNIAGARWQVPGRPTLHVVAYTELSSAKQSDLLSKIKPDIIICDEAHSVRNRTASRTKRFLRYLAEFDSTKLFAWSGTLTSRSLHDYAHLATHALGDNSPVPEPYPVVEEWAGALDPSDFRKAPGALLKFCEPGEKLVDAYRRRLVESPGVVTSPDSGGCQAGLYISELAAKAPEKVTNLLTSLVETAERPDGEQLVDVLSVQRAERELACGFYYRWRWPRKEPVPVIEEWLRVRKEWHKELRERLKHSGEHMDSPLLLTKAAIRWHDGYVHIEHDTEGRELKRVEVKPRTRNGPLKTWNSEWWPQWKAVRDTACPEPDAVWVDKYLVKLSVDWLASIKGSGAILWYDFRAFGQAVVEECRVRKIPYVYCGPGEEGNQKLLSLTGRELCIMSIKAHGTGKNLQMFNKNLVANPPSSGSMWEQLLGRTHRTGQEADEVTVEVFRHTEAMRKAVDTARELSEYIEGTWGVQQKLASKATWGF